MMKSSEKKMMQTVRYSAVAAIIPACLLSVAMLISVGDAAQAKSRAACGKELQRQCTGMPSLANNMLACLAKARVSAKCHAVAQNVVRSCERDAVQFCQAVVAGQGNILGCLTAARGVVSAPCNAALDAAFVR
jgi:hypothetical protein